MRDNIFRRRGGEATNSSIRITRKQLIELRRHLLRADRVEQHALALGWKEEGRLEIREVLLTGPDEYESHSGTHLVLSIDFTLRARDHCRRVKPDLILQIHSHPFAQRGRFSSIDDADFPEFVYDFTRDDAARICGRWVWGQKLEQSSLQICAGGSDLRNPREVGYELLRQPNPVLPA